MKKDLIKQAHQLGQTAFKNNLKSIPVQDIQLMNFISSVRSEIGTAVGSSTFIFKAWSKGWHQENMKGC